MSLISSIIDLFKAMFLNLLAEIWQAIKDLLPLILVVVLILCAPYLAGVLAGWGAPAFIVEGLTLLGSLAPYITATGAWIATNALALGTAFLEAGGWTQLAIFAGAAALLAPEEFAVVVGEVVEAAVDLVSTVVGAIAGGLASSPLGLLAMAVGGFWLLGKVQSKDEESSSGQTEGALA